MVRNTALRLGAAGTWVANIHSNAFRRTLPEFKPPSQRTSLEKKSQQTFGQATRTKQKLALRETFVLALAEF
jgi:hypothetical protein